MPFIAEKLGDFCTGCGQPIVPGDRVAGGPHPKPFYHIECWPKESQAPRQGQTAVPTTTPDIRSGYEFELSSKRDPRPERRVVKVICPHGTTATEAAELMAWLKEIMRVSGPRG
jgi:hypothetical protein